VGEPPTVKLPTQSTGFAAPTDAIRDLCELSLAQLADVTAWASGSVPESGIYAGSGDSFRRLLCMECDSFFCALPVIEQPMLKNFQNTVFLTNGEDVSLAAPQITHTPTVLCRSCRFCVFFVSCWKVGAK